MTPKQIERSVFLLAALNGIPDVRKGLKAKTKYGPMRLEIQAYEDEGGGGTSHGDILLPVDYADDVLKPVEDRLRRELTELGVKLPKRPGESNV